jgi:hypothetical protein
MNKRNKSTTYFTVHELNLFNHFCVHKRAPLCVYQIYFFLLYFETENSQAIIYVHPKMDYFVTDRVLLFKREGLSRDSNPGPPAPKAGIIPLDH